MVGPIPSPDYDFWPPRIKPSPGAFCTQAHVFGTADRFRYAAGRGYILPDAPIATYSDRLHGIRLPAMQKGAVGSDQLHGFGA
tara:strand:- start:242 stop:490 length:249 start_codon:yes stop_codon:yes gene_type:complete